MVVATSGTTVNNSDTIVVPSVTESFSYDLDGNLTQDARWSYTWDAENRLIRLVGRVSGVQPTQVDYEYDWRGRRIKKVVTGSITTTAKYLYDGWNLVAEIDGNNALVRSYMWGLDLSGSVQGAGGVGGLIYVKPAAGNAHFCAYDGNGNVMALVDGGNGNVSAEYEYGAFGEPIRATGTMAVLNPFRFSTKFTDDESDFIYFGYRYYNPSTGRWISRDIVGEASSDGPNIFSFSRNDGINRFDADGKESWGFPSIPVIRNPTPLPAIDCSGYLALRNPSDCTECGKQRRDLYPRKAYAVCKGFAKQFTGDPQQIAASCVASCLIRAESRIQKNEKRCEDRNCLRLFAHVSCYAKCGFSPNLLQLPPGADVVGWQDLIPSCLGGHAMLAGL